MGGQPALHADSNTPGPRTVKTEGTLPLASLLHNRPPIRGGRSKGLTDLQIPSKQLTGLVGRWPKLEAALGARSPVQGHSSLARALRGLCSPGMLKCLHSIGWRDVLDSSVKKATWLCVKRQGATGDANWAETGFTIGAGSDET